MEGKELDQLLNEKGISESVDILGLLLHNMLKIEMRKIVCNLKIAVSMWRRQIPTTITKSWENSLLPKHREYRQSVGRTQKRGQWVSEEELEVPRAGCE